MVNNQAENNTDKWLVTGGAGFIGGNFVLRQILKNKRSVVNFRA